jgi:two-component system sensor histidine kinase DesK
VTSYRQPSLAAELVSSRRILASAGTECQIRAPGAYSLPPAVDALLAWTVREGATNIVRHASAKHAEIVIELTDTTASACLSDDGVGPGKGTIPGIVDAPGPGAAAGAAATGAAGDAAPDPGAGGLNGTGEAPQLAAPVAGSGLAGLAERAARLGGTLSTGAAERGGFWLRVSVPLGGPPPAKAVGEPGRERTPS